MRQTTGTSKSASEKIVKDIKRATGKHYSSEEEIRNWTFQGLVPVRMLIQAAFLWKANGLFHRSAECLRRGL